MVNMIEVFKQMVAALEDTSASKHISRNAAIQAGLKAIKELESQEPVAVVDGDAHNIKVRLLIGGINLEPDTKLYTHSPQRTEPEPVVEMKALADNDSAYAYADGWNACVRKFKDTHSPQRTWIGLTHQQTKNCMQALDGKDAYVLCRAIEATLKEQNNA